MRVSGSFYADTHKIFGPINQSLDVKKAVMDIGAIVEQRGDTSSTSAKLSRAAREGGGRGEQGGHRSGTRSAICGGGGALSGAPNPTT